MGGGPFSNQAPLLLKHLPFRVQGTDTLSTQRLDFNFSFDKANSQSLIKYEPALGYAVKGSLSSLVL